MISSLKNFVKNIISDPEFIGNFRNFENIELYDDYDNNEIAKKYVSANFSNSTLKKNISFSPGLEIIKKYLLEEKKQVKILDFGGGIGTVYKFLFSNNIFTEKDLIIVLYETQNMISEIKDFVFRNKIDIQMSFTSILPKEKFDIIYLGSSLQYFENYKNFLDYLCEHSNNIIMDDIPVSNKKTFANIQVNLKPLKLPAWVFSEEELIDYFKKKKWKISFFYRNSRNSIHKNSPRGMKRSGISIHLEKEIK